jgi:hypothetical protein
VHVSHLCGLQEMYQPNEPTHIMAAISWYHFSGVGVQKEFGIHIIII